jgi:hypothetical protein
VRYFSPISGPWCKINEEMDFKNPSNAFYPKASFMSVK